MRLQRFLIVSMLLGICSCSKNSKTEELLRHLMANFSTDIRPGLDTGQPLVVNISLNLVALTKLNEVEGYISTIGFLDVVWFDERMSWEPSLFEGVSSLSMPSDKVWTPEIFISNPAEKMQVFGEVVTAVRYTSEGWALWRPGSVMKTICFIRVPAYPFDVHTCPISIMLWGLVPSEAVLQSPTDKVVTMFYSENSEWDLTETSVLAQSINNQLSRVSFDVKFSRKSAFLVVNIVIPIAFLSILNSFVFLLPQESGERISFSVTVLLSFTVFLNVIGDNVPKTSSPMPLLCHYVIIVLVTSGVITLSAILCQRLYQACDREPVPQWLLAVFCMTAAVCQNKIRVLKESEDKTTFAKESTDKLHEQTTLRQIILKLDKLLFLLFFILAILFALGFIIAMARIQV